MKSGTRSGKINFSRSVADSFARYDWPYLVIGTIRMRKP